MKLKLTFSALAIATLSGCAVPVENEQAMQEAKLFQTPSEGNAVIYMYREDSIFGSGLKKDLYLNGKCVGETAKGVFFRKEVEANKEYEIATESEFSPNKMVLFVNASKNYFVKQFIKPGVFVGGADVKQVSETEGKNTVLKLDMAKPGTCNSLY
ncbi:DUF2846 domain-containing protein [Vibrio jasicida]|uniref:DUF2846 domain-containing protein n=1 Tax=Vibrio jasicida TaxID=766224 RepID=UPI004068B701